MRRFSATLLLALASVVLLTGCPTGPRFTLMGEDSALVGTWGGTVVIQAEAPREVMVVFGISEFEIEIFQNGGDITTIKGSYRVDQGTTPNRIELGVNETSTDMRELRRATLKGVYQRVGDTLDMSHNIHSRLGWPLGVDVGEYKYELTRVSR